MLKKTTHKPFEFPYELYDEYFERMLFNGHNLTGDDFNKLNLTNFCSMGIVTSKRRIFFSPNEGIVLSISSSTSIFSNLNEKLVLSSPQFILNTDDIKNMKGKQIYKIDFINRKEIGIIILYFENKHIPICINYDTSAKNNDIKVSNRSFTELEEYVVVKQI
jgi:hypothetical protein